MTEPQSWVLIGVFATIMLGGMTIMTTLINRTTTAAVNGLRGELNARFEAVEARSDARFTALDRDIATLFKRAID